MPRGFVWRQTGHDDVALGSTISAAPQGWIASLGKSIEKPLPIKAEQDNSHPNTQARNQSSSSSTSSSPYIILVVFQRGQQQGGIGLPHEDHDRRGICSDGARFDKLMDHLVYIVHQLAAAFAQPSDLL